MKNKVSAVWEALFLFMRCQEFDEITPALRKDCSRRLNSSMTAFKKIHL